MLKNDTVFTLWDTMSLPHKAIKSIKMTKLQLKTIDKKYKLQDCDLEL